MKSYLKTSFILIAGSLVLQNCKDDTPKRNCDKHYTLNQGYLDELLFDYEHTDTLKYKRIVNDVIFDTLVFVKKKRFRDTLLFNNQSVAGDEACRGSEFTRERIGWDYSSQYDSIYYNVQVIAKGSGGKGNDEFLVLISKNFNLSTPLGSAIGNYGVKPLNPYITSEKIYDYSWWTFLVNTVAFTDYGETDYKYRVQLDWKCFYNIKYGYVEISKIDRTEVWELIP